MSKAWNTLYSKGSNGELRQWDIRTEGNQVIVSHGMVAGKIQTKITKSKGKNAGKANATTDEQQAEVEAEAKWVKQKKSGYFETQAEALTYIDPTPMKCQNYNDQCHKITYPCYIQPKLNGLRMMIDKDGKAWSKSGEPYKLPKHIQDAVDLLSAMDLIPDGLDGEIFTGVGVLSLQEIVSAFRKPNENTHKLKYFVYDAPSEFIQANRLMSLVNITAYNNHSGNKATEVVEVHVAHDENEGDRFYETWVRQGYEGAIYRNATGVYEHGRRSYDVIKRKPRLDEEAKVVAVREDKNGDGVITGELKSGVQFDFLMRKDSDPVVNYRKYDSALTLIGKFVTVEYEELSDALVPTKPVGIGVRAVNPDTWEPKE
jgi:ATP-dependent DNA ligase